MGILNTLIEWLLSTADAIIAFIFSFILIVIAFLILFIGSLFEDENSIYCESLGDTPFNTAIEGFTQEVIEGK